MTNISDRLYFLLGNNKDFCLNLLVLLQVGFDFNLAYIKTVRKSVPSEIYEALQGNFGDLHIQLLEVNFIGEI